MDNFDEQYQNAAKLVYDAAASFLSEFWGERCPDYEPLCDCCKRWRALDVLTCAPGDHLDTTFPMMEQGDE